MSCCDESNAGRFRGFEASSKDVSNSVWNKSIRTSKEGTDIIESGGQNYKKDDAGPRPFWTHHSSSHVGPCSSGTVLAITAAKIQT
jgi:hypothetical protein